MEGLYPLKDAYVFGKNTFNRIKKEMSDGRTCGVDHDAGILAQSAYNSGNGNYVETGSLFGASAIIVALVKKHFNLDGFIYCVDPFDGYYGTGNKTKGGTPSLDILWKNAKQFGVADRIKPVAHSSYPWPVELVNETFTMAFIDGDHWGEMPWKDFISVSTRTSKVIQFDDYDNIHPAVVSAAIKASVYPSWVPVYVGGISYVLEHTPELKDPHVAAGGHYG